MGVQITFLRRAKVTNSQTLLPIDGVTLWSSLADKGKPSKAPQMIAEKERE